MPYRYNTQQFYEDHLDKAIEAARSLANHCGYLEGLPNKEDEKRTGQAIGYFVGFASYLEDAKKRLLNNEKENNNV